MVGDDDAGDRGSAASPQHSDGIGHHVQSGVGQVDPGRDYQPCAGQADQHEALERLEAE